MFEAPKKLYEILVERRSCERSLEYFVKKFWHCVEPSNPLVWNWTMSCICEHLQAVSEGDLQKIVFNVPPGFSKSLLVNVFYQAWEWTTNPHYRYLCFSYSQALTIRDNKRFIQLVTSPEYKALWGDDVFRLQGASVELSSNNRTGWKMATSIGSGGTGFRGNRIILDDPNNVAESESKAVLMSTNRWVAETMPSRLNDLDKDAIIVIQQRTNELDVTGFLFQANEDYEFVTIPMEYDSQRHCTTSIGWTDPRSEDGELAFPERFPPHIVEITKKRSSYAWASQYQQSPAPRGGGIIKESWWQLYPEGGEEFNADGSPAKKLEYPQMDIIIASVDTAYTTKTANDFSAMTIWGIWLDQRQEPKCMLMYGWKEHLELHQLVKKIENDCRIFRVEKLLIEGKASGIDVINELYRLFDNANFGIEQINPKGDKESRLVSVSHIFENGVIYAPVRDWSEMVISAVGSFPKGNLDIPDTVSQALRWLRDNNYLYRKDEHQSYVDVISNYTNFQPKEALYDV
jgi:predicted phage terminase large subunit-like protein